MDARIGRIVDPPALEAADDIVTTEWELQNFAVEVVCDQLVKEGWQFMSWSYDPEVNRSLWFGQNAGPTWVVIRAARYPENDA